MSPIDGRESPRDRRTISPSFSRRSINTSSSSGSNRHDDHQGSAASSRHMDTWSRSHAERGIEDTRYEQRIAPSYEHVNERRTDPSRQRDEHNRQSRRMSSESETAEAAAMDARSPTRPSMSISSILNDDDGPAQRREKARPSPLSPHSVTAPIAAPVLRTPSTSTPLPPPVTTGTQLPAPIGYGSSASPSAPASSNGLWPPPVRSVEFDRLTPAQQAAIVHASGRRKTNAYNTDADYDPAYEADQDVLFGGCERALARIKANPELFDPRRDEAIRKAMAIRDGSQHQPQSNGHGHHVPIEVDEGGSVHGGRTSAQPAKQPHAAPHDDGDNAPLAESEEAPLVKSGKKRKAPAAGSSSTAQANGNSKNTSPRRARNSAGRNSSDEEWQPMRNSKGKRTSKGGAAAAAGAKDTGSGSKPISAGATAAAAESQTAVGSSKDKDEQPAKRKKLRIVKNKDDSDLETDENVPLWAPALERYREEAYKRREALDLAYGLMEDEQDERVAKTIARGYMLRYDAILHEEAKAEAERARLREVQRKREARRQEKLAKEKREREALRDRQRERDRQRARSDVEARKQRERREKAIEDELLGTLTSSGSKKSSKQKQQQLLLLQGHQHADVEADEDEETEDEMPLAARYLPPEAARVTGQRKSRKGQKKRALTSVADAGAAAAANAAVAVKAEREEDGDEEDDDDMPLANGDAETSVAAAVDIDSLAGGSRMPSPDMDDRTGIDYTESGYVVIDERRAKALEEAHRKIWTMIAKKEIPKVSRTVQMSYTNKATYWRRISQVVQREARRAVTRNTKTVKDVQLRARKIMREMLVFWRRNEKEERELRKKAEKEAVERAKKEEEMREAKRQARKLNFLITQTELYSHFVGSKLKTDEAEETDETSGSAKIINPAAASGDVPQVDAQSNLKEIDFDDEDETNLRAHAMRNAEEAVNAARRKAVAFDQNAAEERRRNEAAAAAHAAADEEAAADGKRIAEKDLGKAFDSDDMNFLNPTSMGAMDLKQPKMLTCQLKEYQLKGLNWLANLYEQGINGILADEMGLGKTVQSISLMAYLAEVHDIWGPFLVIAPASTLHNWQQEISRFVPSLKALPYWGNVKDRAVLRKFWNKKQMAYNRDAPFHVLVTSYQLVVSDEKYFQRVKWQYMILDEAQAIKSSSSTRWKTLLGFNCRNRLLLTGTPVQNSMQELWALLHFIMPSLFDSHDEFSEWFSKDIESHAENKGTLNEHQLRRLHMILKPFMLRRIKKNVQNELGEKIEIDLFCDMSARQRALYRGLRSHVSIAELMDKASNMQDEAGLKSLMNLVMQFRKVCNHPELFERADVEAPFAFAESAQSGSLSREGDSLFCPYSTVNPIKMAVPKLMYQDSGMLTVPGASSRAGFDTHYMQNLFNIWRPHHILQSLGESQSAFSTLPLMDLPISDAEIAFHGRTLINVLRDTDREERLRAHGTLLFDEDFAAASIRPFAYVRKALPSIVEPVVQFGVPSMDEIAQDAKSHSVLAPPSKRAFVRPAVAPPIELVCSDRSFTMRQEALHTDPLASAALFGLPGQRADIPKEVEGMQAALPALPPRGLLAASSQDQLPASGMQVPQMNKLIVDSSKLARLDALLRELRAGGHRVLIYFQMTKMIDLMEEYLIYRQYKYLRLDGASKISDRRDMVTDWQTKPEIFIFLLSTRAGGLGINLTAADTVIFYDHDWNPSNDSQAMDRAHRLGQTKQVTVYRLITKGTIDERIVKLARNKKEVQDIVVGNKAYSETGMARPQEIVSLLLDDDELAESMLRRKQAEEQELIQAKADSARAMHAKRKLNKAAAVAAEEAAKAQSALVWELEDDEDDFFGAKPPPRMEDEAPAAESLAGAKPSKKKKTKEGGEGGEISAPKKRSKSKAKPVEEGAAGIVSDAPKPPLKSRLGRDKSHRKKTAEELGGVEATVEE